MEFQDELAEVLGRMDLANPVIQLETSPGGKVGGYVVSRAFEGKSQMDRQNMVWDFLEGVLTKEQQLRIISILTLIPDEADVAA